MDLGLKEKIAIVAGGASNIGRAISITLAGEGATVVIVDIDKEQMEKVVETINASGNKATAMKTDATDYNEVEKMVKKVMDQFGKIDILINSIGWDRMHFFVETTPDFWDTVININFRVALNCYRLVLPHMIERNSGNIISISSDAGRIGEFQEGVYSGCKAAQIALSKTVAKEVGRYGIRVNVVCPGLTLATKPEEVGELGRFGRGFAPPDPERIEKASKLYALRRIGKAQDIANAVAFLASDAASFITGQTLSVSGGYSMM